MKLKKNHNKKSREKNLSQLGLIKLTRHMRHEIRKKKHCEQKCKLIWVSLTKPLLK
jgi:hypothetical protein